MEIWKKIPGWPYEVCNDGRIRRSSSFSNQYPKGRIIRGGSWGSYPTVLLSSNGTHKTFVRHLLVAEAFLGPCPPGYEVNHIDGNKSNPRADNLEYVTGSENINHAVRNGMFPIGSRRWNAVLTEDIVVEMRRMHLMGNSIGHIAERFGANFTTVYHVVKRHNWKHVS